MSRSSKVQRAALLIGIVSAAWPSYGQTQIIDLGTLGGNESRALAVNNRGQVVGWSRISATASSAFYWDPNQGMIAIAGDGTQATDISDTGLVVGWWAGQTASGYRTYMFLWRDGAPLPVPARLSTLFATTAYGVNAMDEFVGYGWDACTPPASVHAQGYIWSDPNVLDLTAGFAGTIAYAVNDLGDVVGTRVAGTCNGAIGSAAAWFAGSYDAPLRVDGYAQALAYTAATDINNSRQIVGGKYPLDATNPPHNPRAFLWESGALTDIGSLGGDESAALAINESGLVVGTAQDANNMWRAFVWNTYDRAITDLNSLLPPGSGWTLLEAWDVSDTGYIVGAGELNGEIHAFRLVLDCNGNGVPDGIDILTGASEDCNGGGVPDECEILSDCDNDGIADVCDPAPDCNGNGIPDQCDIGSGASEDCNSDGVPDECQVCKLDIVFLVDTSQSLGDEIDGLCGALNNIEATIAGLNVSVAAAPWSITPNQLYCLSGAAGSVGAPVPGSSFLLGDCADSQSSLEDWGPATTLVAQTFPWRNGAARVIVPISDEAPRCGGVSCETDDSQSIAEAITACQLNAVYAFPVMGQGTPSCVATLANDLASATGGTVTDTSTVDPNDLDEAISGVILDVISATCDCNLNGVPDVCDLDCNGDGVPDECQSLGGFTDCDVNGIPDDCDISEGFASDYDGNGVLDKCECLGDIDRDGDIDLADFAMLLSAFGTCAGQPGYNPNADVNVDGCVGGTDLAIVLSRFESECL